MARHCWLAAIFLAASTATVAAQVTQQQVKSVFLFLFGWLNSVMLKAEATRRAVDS